MSEVECRPTWRRPFDRWVVAPLRALFHNDDGAVVIYVSMISLVLLSLGALAIDVGRTVTTHTQLQNAADAAALAAASQLTGDAGARDAARAAAISALQNRQAFVGSGGLVGIAATDCNGAADNVSCIGFLSGIPADDNTAIDYTVDGATSDLDAIFVEVRVVPETMSAIFNVAAGLDSDIEIAARAVAAPNDTLCDVPPLFMCNPVESDPTLSLSDLNGREVVLGKGSGGFGPGNYGLLCPLDFPNCGASIVLEYLGSRSRGICINDFTDLPVKPGVTSNMVEAGVNSRLDIFPAQTKDWMDDSDYSPASNVTQGGEGKKTGQKCEYDDLPAETAMGLPNDVVPDGQWLGDGVWDYAEYFRINHGGDGTSTFRPTGWANTFLGNTGTPTRYQAYRHEVENGVVPQPGNTIFDEVTGDPLPDPTSEDGDVECHNAPVADTGTLLDPTLTSEDLLEGLFADRRVMTFASVDCVAQGAPSGRTTVRPNDIIFAFLTRPIEDATLRLEFIVPANIDNAMQTLARQNVQIYRR